MLMPNRLKISGPVVGGRRAQSIEVYLLSHEVLKALDLWSDEEREARTEKD